MTVQELVLLLVPRDWTGEEALAATRALNEAVDAIWLVHGERMAAVLFGDEPVEERDEPAEELPF